MIRLLRRHYYAATADADAAFHATYAIDADAADDI